MLAQFSCGDALSGAQLTLRRDGTEQRTRADRNGEFRFQRIARGTYQLVAEAKGRVAQARAVAIGAGRSEPEERFDHDSRGVEELHRAEGPR